MSAADVHNFARRTHSGSRPGPPPVRRSSPGPGRTTPRRAHAGDITGTRAEPPLRPASRPVATQRLTPRYKRRAWARTSLLPRDGLQSPDPDCAAPACRSLLPSRALLCPAAPPLDSIRFDPGLSFTSRVQPERLRGSRARSRLSLSPESFEASQVPLPSPPPPFLYSRHRCA